MSREDVQRFWNARKIAALCTKVTKGHALPGG
jgi:hypothetical protein